MTVNQNPSNSINRVINSLNRMKIATKLNKQIDQDYAAMIENTNDKQELLNNILNEQNLNKTQKADICFAAFLKTEDKEFLSYATKYKSDYKFIKLVIEALDNPEGAESWDYNLLRDENTKNQLKFFKKLKLTNEELSDLGGLYLIKTEVISTLSEELKKQSQQKIEIEQKTGWYNNKINVSYDEAFEIKDFNGGKLYGYISTKYNNSEWENALSNGYAKSRFGQNGVKLENGVAELKINKDARLYTQELHKNDLGDFIAIFNKKAGHPAISNLISKSKDIAIYDDCYHQEEYQQNYDIDSNILGDYHYDSYDA